MKKRICSIFCMTILLMTLVFCLPAFAEDKNLFPDPGFDGLGAIGTSGESSYIADSYQYLKGSVNGYQFAKRENGTGNPVVQLCGARSGACPVVVWNKQAFVIDNEATYTLSFDFAMVESYGTHGSSYTNEPGVFQIFVGSEPALIPAVAERDAGEIAEAYDVTYINTYEFANTIASGVYNNISFEIPAGHDAKYFYIRFLSDMFVRIDNLSFYGPEGEVVEPEEPELPEAVYGGLWADTGFDLVTLADGTGITTDGNVSAESPYIWSNKYGNYNFSARENGTGNKVIQLCGKRSGAYPVAVSNKVAFENVDNTKKYTLTFDTSLIVNYGYGGDIQVYVGTEAEAIPYVNIVEPETIEARYGVVYVDTVELTSAHTTGYHTMTVDIPAGTDFKYLYLRTTKDCYLRIDNVSIVEGETAVETISPVISLTAPVANVAPQNTVTGTGYTGTVSWSPSVTDKFAYNTVYTATIKIAAESGYTTAGIAANGYTVSGADSVVNEKDSDTITVTFPATAKKVVTQTKVYEPYTLSYNSNHKDTGNYRGAPHAGWVLDNRGGTNMNVNSADYNVVRDISTTEAVSFYKNLNKVDEGVVTLETAFKIIVGRDGFKIRFTDEDGATVYSLETVSGSFKVLQSNGTYRTLCSIPSNYSTTNIRVVVKLDFDNKLAHTYINDTYYSQDALLSDNIMRFAYMTSKENTVTVNLTDTTKITANYHVHDDFLYYPDSTKTIPYGWASSSSTYAYVSASEGHVSNNKTLTKMLDTGVSGKVAFEGIFYAEAGANGVFELIDGEGNKVIDLTINGTNFTSSSTTVYSNYSKNIWNRFRIEADLVNHKALVKINGRAIKNGENDLYINIPADIEEVSGIKISGTTSTEIIFDDIQLFSLVEHDDYVPEPELPTPDEYSVGINVCPLWSYESVHTWANISPYEEFRPVLGYYDEGNPEVADWEIKMLAEHGVDFQAFCWYADKANEPLKHQTHSMALHDGYMNAKYSDMMKYAIIWEAGSGTLPESMQAVYDYFVPYWIENYFKDDRYMTVDGKLIMYVYDYGKLHYNICDENFSKTKELFTTIKSMVKESTGKDLIIISVSTSPSDSNNLVRAGLDGVSAYHWGTEGYDWDHIKSGIESSASKARYYTWTIPTISTGFNNMPWVEGGRNPNMSVEDFKEGLTWIKDTYFKTYTAEESWQNNLVMLSNWNEYGEGTYIMPSGLNGFGYLDAVREVFTNGSNANTHTDYTLTDEQLSRIGKNYPQYYKPIRRTFDESEILKNDTKSVDGKLYIDGTLIQSPDKATDSSNPTKDLPDSLLPEKTESGAIYFPFDAYWINSIDYSTSISHFLKLHYEWEYDWENPAKLTLYGKNDKFAVFTEGSNVVTYHGGEITLPDAVYMRDGYPMLHMETVCEIFGYKYAYAGNNLYITTVDQTTANNNFWPNETFDNANGLTKVAGNSSTTITNGVMHLGASSSASVYGIYRNTEAISLPGTSVLKFDYKSDSGDSSAYIQLAIASIDSVGPSNYHEYDDIGPVTNITSTWQTYEVEIPSDVNYIYFRVRGNSNPIIDIDNVKLTVKQETGAAPTVVAAGLKDANEEKQSIAFAGYTAENNPEGFGFEISADNGKTVVIDTTGKVVATNGAFCKLDSLAGNFYIVSVNDIPARHFDCDLTVRAYAIFDNKVVYSEPETVSVNDILNGSN